MSGEHGNCQLADDFQVTHSGCRCVDAWGPQANWLSSGLTMKYYYRTAFWSLTSQILWLESLSLKALRTQIRQYLKFGSSD
jgi:hypothetical protein